MLIPEPEELVATSSGGHFQLLVDEQMTFLNLKTFEESFSDCESVSSVRLLCLISRSTGFHNALIISIMTYDDAYLSYDVT